MTPDPTDQDANSRLETQRANHDNYTRTLEHDLNNYRFVAGAFLAIIGLLIGVMVALCV